MLQRYFKYIQPIGFALLLLHFLVTPNAEIRVILWAGVAFTVAGTIGEIYFYLQYPRRRRTQVGWVFAAGIISKSLLIAAIVLRVYDVPYSIFILLGCILLSVIWFALNLLVKPSREDRGEFLDVD